MAWFILVEKKITKEIYKNVSGKLLITEDSQKQINALKTICISS